MRSLFLHCLLVELRQFSVQFLFENLSSVVAFLSMDAFTSESKIGVLLGSLCSQINSADNHESRPYDLATEFFIFPRHVEAHLDFISLSDIVCHDYDDFPSTRIPRNACIHSESSL